MAVDERSEVSFRPQRDVSVATIFVGQTKTQIIHRTGFACDSLDGGVRQEVQVLRWTQANQLTDQLSDNN